MQRDKEETNVQSSVGQTAKERVLWMDVLNIVAMMGVVLLHCSNGPVHHWDGCFNAPYVWGVFTHTVALWPVCIFLMLSGANLIGAYPSEGGGELLP